MPHPFRDVRPPQIPGLKITQLLDGDVVETSLPSGGCVRTDHLLRQNGIVVPAPIPGLIVKEVINE
jgi:hypothetical protein